MSVAVAANHTRHTSDSTFKRAVVAAAATASCHNHFTAFLIHCKVYNCKVYNFPTMPGIVNRLAGVEGSRATTS
jgi:hypothetical protein